MAVARYASAHGAKLCFLTSAHQRGKLHAQLAEATWPRVFGDLSHSARRRWIGWWSPRRFPSRSFANSHRCHAAFTSAEGLICPQPPRAAHRRHRHQGQKHHLPSLGPFLLNGRWRSNSWGPLLEHLWTTARKAMCANSHPFNCATSASKVSCDYAVLTSLDQDHLDLASGSGGIPPGQTAIIVLVAEQYHRMGEQAVLAHSHNATGGRSPLAADSAKTPSPILGNLILNFDLSRFGSAQCRQYRLWP